MDNEPTLDPLQEQKQHYEEALKIIHPDRPSLAVEAYHKLIGAGLFFELGLELGKLDPEQAEALISEIKERLKKDEHELREGLYPARKPGNTSYRAKQ
jgi:hypothetical protein